MSLVPVRIPHNPCVGVSPGGTRSGPVSLWVKRGEARDWTVQLPISNDDVRWNFSTAMSLLGDARDPTYAHLLVLGHYFDQVYHQGRFPGELPKCRLGQANEVTKEWYYGRCPRYATVCAASTILTSATVRSCHLLP